MKKILLCLFILLTVGCTPKVITDSTYVYLPDPAKESQYNDYMISIVEGIEDLTVVESKDSTEFEKNVKAINGSNADLIISTESFVKVAKENGLNFKNQKIVALSNESVTKYLNDNIIQSTYKINNAGFLAGIAASYYAKYNGARQVGYIINEESDINSRLLAGFEDGVWQEYPECTIYISSTVDGENISEVIKKMQNVGVSIIFTMTCNSDTSVVDEITKHRLEDENIYAVVYDSYPRIAGEYFLEAEDSNEDEPQLIKKNSIYFRIIDDNATAINEILKDFESNKLEGPIPNEQKTAFITEILNDSENINQNELEEKIATFKALINSGEIVVRTNPSNINVESRLKIVE